MRAALKRIEAAFDKAERERTKTDEPKKPELDEADLKVREVLERLKAKLDMANRRAREVLRQLKAEFDKANREVKEALERIKADQNGTIWCLDPELDKARRKVKEVLKQLNRDDYKLIRRYVNAAETYLGRDRIYIEKEFKRARQQAKYSKGGKSITHGKFREIVEGILLDYTVAQLRDVVKVRVVEAANEKTESSTSDRQQQYIVSEKIEKFLDIVNRAANLFPQ